MPVSKLTELLVDMWSQVSLFTAAATLFMGTYSLAKNPTHLLNRSFAIFCASISYYAFTEYKYREAMTSTEAGMWIRAGSMFPLILSFMIYFTLVFLEKKEWSRKKVFLLAFAPGLLLSFLEFLTGYGRGPPVKQYWGWSYSPDTNPLSVSITAWMFFGFLFSFYLVINFYRDAGDGNKKQQAKWLGTGLVISSLFTILTTGVARRLDIVLPNLAAPSYLLLFLCVGWAMWKYGLFIITPALIAQNILSTMSNFILAVDLSGTIAVVNPAAQELLQYREEELVGQPLESVLAEPRLVNTIKQTRPIGSSDKVSSRSLQTDFVTSTKEQVPVLVSISSVQNHPKRGAVTVLVGTDLRPFLELEDIKEKLANTVLYELKSPVAGIYLTVKNIQNIGKTIPSDKIEEMHTVIENNATLLVEMIEKLHYVSKIDRKKAIPRWTPCNLTNILQNALTRMNYLIVRKNITVEMIAPPKVESWGDERMLEQIGLVLLENALKYSDGASRIVIKLVDKYQGSFNSLGVDGMLLQVIDEGRGMPRKSIKHVFTRFYRADNVQDVSGAGLGLFIARRLAKLHGGEIYVDSELGRGSVFSVFLPRLDHSPERQG
ncbi:MAG: ATP-binding protein [Candidatus Odinarchaeota archaeon]